MRKRLFLPIFLFLLLLILAWVAHFPVFPTEQAPLSHPEASKGSEIYQYSREVFESFSLAICQTLGNWIVWFTNPHNSDVISAISTAIIAVFTLVLGVSTLKLYSVTKIAAIAARKSADTLVTTERPYLFFKIRNVVVNEGIQSGQNRRDTKISLHYFVENLGRTPGLINEVSVRTYYRNEPFPDHDYFIHQSRLHGMAVAAGKSSASTDFENTIELTKDELSAALRKQAYLWLIGRVVYTDMTDTGEFEHRFLYRHDRKEGVFVRHPHPVFTKSK